MNIAVMGAGYVGLVTSGCFAELGNQVTCIDIDEEKIKNLKSGHLPIYEPGLATLIESNLKSKRLHFTTTLENMAGKPEVIFIAVGTPSEESGKAYIEYVIKAAKAIGSFIDDYTVIVDKSTVPVGMAVIVAETINNELKAKNSSASFDIVSNPEFLREGAAIVDFMTPDRVIIGVQSKRARALMHDLYHPIVRNPEKIFFMQVKDAEMTKYAANAMLASRISFMNEIALLCEKMGVDVENVRIGIGSDQRIGSSFLNAGCGYGGSCFPKDVKALIYMAELQGIDPIILKAVEARNNLQKLHLATKIMAVLGNDLSQKEICLWGLSFKPETDDMREASSVKVIEKLIEKGAKIKAYDPIAMPIAKMLLPNEWFSQGNLTLVDDQYEALHKVDALALVTEWKPFCYPDLSKMRNKMRQHIIFDGRNQYNPTLLREAGFDYYGIGR